MKITIYFKDLKADYIFSNEDLKVGDQVFPITDDRIIDGEHTLTGLTEKGKWKESDFYIVSER